MRLLPCLFTVVVVVAVFQCEEVSSTDRNEMFAQTSESTSILADDKIYKCVSYTSAHIDISHLITEDFQPYKDCRQPGLSTLNRRNRQFNIDVTIQRSWIVEVKFVLSQVLSFLYLIEGVSTYL